MDCKSTIQQIIELGHTDINEYPDEVRQHLCTCSTCLGLLKEIAETMDKIEQSDPEYRPEFTEEVIAKSGYQRIRTERLPSYEKWLVPLTSIAAIFIGVVIGIALTTSSGQEPSENEIESEISAMILTNNAEMIPDVLIQID